MSAIENCGRGAIWGRLQRKQPVFTAGVTGTSPGQAQPALVSLQHWLTWTGCLQSRKEEDAAATESSAKESNAKYAPRALLTFNYY